MNRINKRGKSIKDKSGYQSDKNKQKEIGIRSCKKTPKHPIS